MSRCVRVGVTTDRSSLRRSSNKHSSSPVEPLGEEGQGANVRLAAKAGQATTGWCVGRGERSDPVRSSIGFNRLPGTSVDF